MSSKRIQAMARLIDEIDGDLIRWRYVGIKDDAKTLSDISAKIRQYNRTFKYLPAKVKTESGEI